MSERIVYYKQIKLDGVLLPYNNQAKEICPVDKYGFENFPNRIVIYFQGDCSQFIGKDIVCTYDSTKYKSSYPEFRATVKNIIWYNNSKNLIEIELQNFASGFGNGLFEAIL